MEESLSKMEKRWKRDGDVHKIISCWPVNSDSEWISVGSKGAIYNLIDVPYARLRRNLAHISGGVYPYKQPRVGDEERWSGILF